MDPRPSIEAALDAFGVPAMVTPPSGAPVATIVFWLASMSVENAAGRREERRRVLVLPFAGLPQVPRGTIVSAPEFEGTAAADWRIDAAEQIDYDHYRAVVVPA